jgi:hypothetical protein
MCSGLRAIALAGMILVEDCLLVLAMTKDDSCNDGDGGYCCYCCLGGFYINYFLWGGGLIDACTGTAE